MIDPAAITLAQSTFLKNINDAFAIVVPYALHLLYFFAAFEVVLTGFAWAFQQDLVWGRALFKIIKIGFMLFIIQNYPTLINDIIRSFADIGGAVANHSNISSVLFNPAKLWAFGYDNGLILLKAAASTTGFGLAMIQIILGMGIILVFGLLGIQVVFQIVSFYFISLFALVLLPFGALNIGANFFERAAQAVLQAGARVMVLITVLGVALTVWGTFQLMPMSEPFNINAPLGLFFTGLLFLYFSLYLPRLAGNAIGKISLRLGGNLSTTMVQGFPSTSGGQVVTAETAQSVQAASMVEPGNRGESMISRVETAAAAPAATTVQAVVSQPAQSLRAERAQRPSESGSLARAGQLERSISEATARALKKTFQQQAEEAALKEITES